MIRDNIFSLLNFEYESDIQIKNTENVFAEFKDGAATVGGADKASIARAFTLFAYEYGKNNGGEFTVEQSPRFENRGVMLDFSRNGVMKPEQVKRYITYMAAHGLNSLWLYMEDVYEVTGYKYFGYMRGRYSIAELKEIDDYAYEMGVEVVPCVQFLGHLEQYLKWSEGDSFKDTPDILLIGEEKTYEFIAAAVKSLKSAFRTNKIHIGMDEAHNVGLGNYLKKHGARNRFEIMNEHLARVMEICRKNGVEPMMWSDMFFRLGSPSGEYYAPDWSVPEEIIADIPDVDMVYWDYYHDSKDDYLSMIQKHKKLGKKIIFAGGVWVWDGFLPNNAYTLKSMIPAMEACVDEGIETVVLTAWEDDGCETNHFMSLPGLAVVSEYCFGGDSVSVERIREMSGFITSTDYAVADRMSDFHNGEIGDVKAGKRYIWSDFLYNLTDYKTDFAAMEKRFENAYKFFGNHSSGDTKLNEYASLLFKIARDKSVLLRSLRTAYINGDTAYLNRVCTEILPNLKRDYKRLHKIHKEQWLATYKPFGWETLDGRYAMMEARAEYAAERISDYLNGVTERIEELEEEPLFGEKPRGAWYANMAYTSVIR